MEELAEIFKKPFEALKQIFIEEGYSEAEASEKAYLFLSYKMIEQLKGEADDE